ncbi:MAG: leucine-rich repeat protein, partial [Oscillospiraceae bacterium]|nr:leucine-rich repeat protein [Oscillospiraceae bacterium]
MKVLAFGCHPDDVEIACAGTLAKFVKQGHEVTVCHVCNGNLGHVEIMPDELREIRIGEGVTHVGDHAFFDCDNLVKVTLPSTLDTIGDGAFQDCDALETLELPQSLTVIGNRAFRDCSALVLITIPASVLSLGEEAFRYCDALKEITFLGSVPEFGYLWADNFDTIGYYLAENETWTAGLVSSIGGVS